MGLIQKRLGRASIADYSNAKDVQTFIQNLVDHEALVDWARRNDRQRVTGVVPPSKMYGSIKSVPWYRHITGLLP
jgi:hypothetical protein